MQSPPDQAPAPAPDATADADGVLAHIPGLPLAKRLTELHGGSLEIVSTPGRGTQVIVRLPASRMLDPTG